MRILSYIFLLLISLQVSAEKTNFVLVMCDDLGWGDTGFNGNKVIKTPHLDKMAAGGMKLNQFYSIGPVCSPSRASFVTGRHYYRSGVFGANFGHLRKQEYTLAKMAKENGYATGHFGKWHLGTLSKTISSKGKKRHPEINFAPPWLRDYDASFVTESAIQTWDPGKGKRARNNAFYENGQVTNENLEGCASRVVVDRLVPFVTEAKKQDKPFMAVLWFHAPHEDVYAGPEYLKMYEGAGKAAHYYGCITALDDQMGRLRKTLNELGVEENTMIIFCSDNGPEGKTAPKDPTKTKRAGLSGGLKGRKRSFHEGGVRVPAFAYWPKKIQAGTELNSALSVLDLLPTVAAVMKTDLPQNRIVDGENVLPILLGQKSKRSKSIPFRYNDHAWIVKGDYKMVITSTTDQSEDMLYNLKEDRAEAENIVKQQPEVAQELRKEILTYLDSFRKSHSGAEYGDSSYKAPFKFIELGGEKSFDVQK